MKLKENSSEQKLRGAYYTPLKLAESMVKLCVDSEVDSILEPSCGDGVFLDALKEEKLLTKVRHITAIEIEKAEAEKVSNNYRMYANVNVSERDFFEFYNEALSKKEQYDLIVGNPPYIRYQYLSEKQRELQADILESHGMKANKLINAWVAFLVANVQLLSAHGKIAFVIPAEILQVAYAEELRLFLANNLSSITLVTFEKLVFPDIEQEIVVFIGEKNGKQNGIRIIEMEDLSSLQNVNFDKVKFQPLHHVKEKWTKYFITFDELKLINKIKNDERFARFSDYGLINVGITTGNNSYFSVTEEVCEEYDLEGVTLPLIGRSSHAHGIYFTNEDWNLNKKNGKSARLLAFPEEISFDEYPKLHKEYIRLGEEQGENKGYKCSIRDRWYIVPSVWIPDAFFLRRNNLYPKFVLNKISAVSTDTMHRIKFNLDVKPENLLLAYYNSIAFAFTEICGRSYGGGVLEILPRELGNIVLPKIKTIDTDLCQEVLKYIDDVIRNDEDIEKALDVVDEKILVEVLGIDAEWCRMCRNIWRKMQKRRLKRS